MSAIFRAPRSNKPFPPFELTRLLRTVFAPKKGESICLLIDLEDPKQIINLDFLPNSQRTPQYYAYEVFFKGLHDKTMKDLGLTKGDLFAYKITGGSNLDLPETAWTVSGKEVNLLTDVYPHYDLIMCISNYSATAPLTAFAKEYGFRGATLHGLNELILNTGLAVDYQEVSQQAERLRAGLHKPLACEIDFIYDKKKYTIHIELNGQEAQKSHGLSHVKGDIANLPAGEVYFVPTNAKGEFPFRFADGTIGLMQVNQGKIQSAKLLKGSQETINAYHQKLQEDPLVGYLGELGIGTQDLPFAGADIQDEKIVGTVHIATGRNDHLGGPYSSKSFVRKEYATHDDILYSPQTTPDIEVPQVRMYWKNRTELLMANYNPQAYMEKYLQEPNYAHQ